MAPGKRCADERGRRPDLRVLALAGLAGVAAAYRCPSFGTLGWLAAAALAGAAAVWRFPRWRYPSAAFCTGILVLGAHALYLQAGRLPAGLNDAERTVAGTVASLPVADAGRVRFLFEPHGGDASMSARRIRVSWYDAPQGRVHAGQCWRLTLKLGAPRGLRNPGGFDYAGWLFRSGIGATAYVRAAEPCARPGPAYPVLVLRDRLARWIATVLDGHPMTGIVQALTLGWQAQVTDTQWQVLRRTGTTHLISISGLHVAVVAGALLAVLSTLWRYLGPASLWLPARRAAAWAVIPGALAYALLAGFTLPTQRALIMLTVALFGLLGDRRAAPGHMLAVALAAVLLSDPFAVGSPGFWLSFGAVAWLLYAFTGRLRPPGKVRAWVRSQAVLLLGLAPLTAFWFQQGSLTAPLANLWMIPLYSALTPVLLLAVACSGIGSLGAWLIQAVAWVMGFTWPALEWMSGLPLASVQLAPPPLTAVALGLLGLVLVLAPRGAPARLPGIALCLPLLLWRPVGPPPMGGARLTVLDVGHGLAVVVRTHEHALLYDAGPSYRTGFNAGRSIVLPFLSWAGVEALDRVVISHPDRDHAGGWPAVREGIAVRSAWDARNGGCRAGRHWRWDGVSFRVLHPLPGGTGSDNDRSCVLRIQAGGHVVLLTGDIESAAEAALLRRVPPSRLRAEVLVVPHHGSESSSSAAFVAAVSPSLALVSTNRGNQWNFPRPAVVRRYRAAGVRVVNTGDVGAIRLRLRPGAPLPAAAGWRRTHRRLWTLP